MSEYSSSGVSTGTPHFGRQPGEIYHTLSWDELDGYGFMYGTNSVQFVEVTNASMANLILQASPNEPLTGAPFPNTVVCDGIPYGTPNGLGGVTI